jgi:hypothetical protein
MSPSVSEMQLTERNCTEGTGMMVLMLGNYATCCPDYEAGEATLTLK